MTGPQWCRGMWNSRSKRQIVSQTLQTYHFRCVLIPRTISQTLKEFWKFMIFGNFWLFLRILLYFKNIKFGCFFGIFCISKCSYEEFWLRWLAKHPYIPPVTPTLSQDTTYNLLRLLQLEISKIRLKTRFFYLM